MRFLKALILFTAIATGVSAQTYGVLPVPRAQFLDSSGRPLSGGFLFSYACGTSTLQPTYVDAMGSAANPNPVVLDAGGRANVWLNSALCYKFVLEDQFSAVIWTADGITSTGGGIAGGGTGSFLPLAGGTMTGAILFGSPATVNIGSPSAGVNNLYVDTGLYLGGVLTLNNTRDATLHNTSVNNLTITGTCTGCTGGGSFLPLAGGTMTGNILVTPTDTVDLGSNSSELNNGYFKNVFISGTCTGPGCGGGGSFLPLSGGTMSGNIQALNGNLYSVGSKPFPFSGGYFQSNVSTTKMEIYPTGATDLTGPFFNLNSQDDLVNKQLIVDDDANLPILIMTRLLGGVSVKKGEFDGDWLPLNDGGGSIGSATGPKRWNNVYFLSQLVQNGTVRIDAAGNTSVNNLTILGTCSGCPGTGGGSFLPIAGGTMMGNIAASTVGTLNLASKLNPFAAGYFLSNLSTTSVELNDGGATDLTGGFASIQAQVNGTNNGIVFRDSSGNLMANFARTIAGTSTSQAIFDFSLQPATDNARDLGGTFPITGQAAWRDIYWKGRLVQNGTTRLDALGNLTVNSCTGCGGSTFTGGTVTGGIFPNADNSLPLGSPSLAWSNTYEHTDNVEQLKVNPTGTSFSSPWTFLATSPSVFLLSDPNRNVLSISTSGPNNYQWGVRGTIFPSDLVSGDADLGLVSNPFGTLYLSSALKMGGNTVIDAGRNVSVQNLTISGTCSGCGAGGGPSLTGTNNWTGLNTFNATTTFNATLNAGANSINAGTITAGGNVNMTGFSGSYQVAGNPVIDSAANAFFNSGTFTGSITATTGTIIGAVIATTVGGNLDLRSGASFNISPSSTLIFSPGGQTGQTCSGTPTSSFATINGIVVHC